MTSIPVGASRLTTSQPSQSHRRISQNQSLNTAFGFSFPENSHRYRDKSNKINDDDIIESKEVLTNQKK